MWERPRPIRTEIISVDTKRLAAHAFGQMGLVCIRAVPVDDKQTRLAVDTMPTPDGREYWFHKLRHATDVLDQVVLLERMPWTASCIDSAVLVDAPVDAVDNIIEEAMRWASRIPRLVSRLEVEAQIAAIERDIQRSLVELQCTGAMSALNKQYKALRMHRAEGEKLPSYKIWATSRLEALVLQLLKPAEVAA
jgi:hypothetical protein